MQCTLCINIWYYCWQTFLLLLTWNFLLTSHTLPQTFAYRKLEAISSEAFKADITNSELIRYPKTNATELAQQYLKTHLFDLVLPHRYRHSPWPVAVTELFPRFCCWTLIGCRTTEPGFAWDIGAIEVWLIDWYDCPQHSHWSSCRTGYQKNLLPPPPVRPNPWMTPDILASKRHCRYLKGISRRNPTALNRSRRTRQIHLGNRQMSKAKSAHYPDIMNEHSGDQGSLWKAFNKILHCCPKMPPSFLYWRTSEYIQLVFHK